MELGLMSYENRRWMKLDIWGCIQKFPDRVDIEIYAYKNKHSFRSNTKGYEGENLLCLTHKIAI
jgi:hypothetical protein